MDGSVNTVQGLGAQFFYFEFPLCLFSSSICLFFSDGNSIISVVIYFMEISNY